MIPQKRAWAFLIIPETALLLAAADIPAWGASGFRMASDAIGTVGGTLTGGGFNVGMTAGLTVTGRAGAIGMTEEAGFWRWGTLPVSGTGEEFNPPGQKPSGFHFAPGSPNPFSRATAIRYSIPETEKQTMVTIRIFDASGRFVRLLERGDRLAGSYVVNWDGRSDSGTRVGAGVYFCLMEAGQFRGVQRMVLAR